MITLFETKKVKNCFNFKTCEKFLTLRFFQMFYGTICFCHVFSSKTIYILGKSLTRYCFLEPLQEIGKRIIRIY